MYQTTQAIVLKSIKYGESSRILKCYTKEFGAQSYMVNSVKSKKSVVRASMLLPLTQLELVASHKGKSTLERIKEARLYCAYEAIPFDPVRNALALFIAEVLSKSLHEEQGNLPTYEFVEGACNLLDHLENVPAHFHIVFLLGLSGFLGFYPRQEQQYQVDYFNLSEGVFQPTQPLHTNFLDAQCTAVLKQMLTENLRNCTHVYPKQMRKKVLAGVLEYYKLHVASFGKLKSVEILEELFA